MMTPILAPCIQTDFKSHALLNQQTAKIPEPQRILLQETSLLSKSERPEIENVTHVSLTKESNELLADEEATYKEGRWTKEEHLRFVSALEKYGSNWIKVQNAVKTRSAAQIRSHAQKYKLKMAYIESQSKLRSIAQRDNFMFKILKSKKRTLRLKMHTKLFEVRKFNKKCALKVNNDSSSTTSSDSMVEVNHQRLNKVLFTTKSIVPTNQNQTQIITKKLDYSQTKKIFEITQEPRVAVEITPLQQVAQIVPASLQTHQPLQQIGLNSIDCANSSTSCEEGAHSCYSKQFQPTILIQDDIQQNITKTMIYEDFTKRELYCQVYKQ
ncbi:myb-like dna-binding shaqkyf class family protein [Stylonychia lemnae]|uniref:Myb-like dna-binding shaqkyf class family protein n=1 Tax=Stylonychia lemnae TaxID=5949 RepID=A0A078A3E7_STYLE|nr:myb-like dna-binding shaqkyf class family protein [Stylonychia lemnae]|eukprot:CDW76038.1 myb-like dna-binding shaqkyf class family protein [Stylonychia lemnae]